MAHVPSDTGVRITRLRVALGLRQTELARLLGVSNVTVNRWEHGHTTPSAAVLGRIAAAEREGASALGASTARATAATLNTLPIPPTSFVGRTADLRELQGLVERRRLVTVVGPGGVGKTRLVLELARLGRLSKAGPVAFVDLAPLTEGDGVPAAIAAGLGLPPDDAEPPLRQIARFRADAQGVVALDNCEHLVAAAAAAAEALLGSCPGLRLVATSRVPLGLAEEAAWALPPLPVEERQPAGSRPGAGAQGDAVALFLDRAERRSPGFTASSADRVAITAICRRLDGLPLAVELAAARMPTMAPDQLLRRLDRRMVLLGSSDGSAPPRHAALEAAIAWSHDLLDGADRRVFRRLGVFAGAFDLDDAEHACRDEALPGLERLVRQSLVTVAGGEAGAPRFRLLESIRVFAAERLREAGEERDTAAAVAEAVIAAVERDEGRRRGEGAEVTHDKAAGEIDTVQSLQIRLAALGETRLALRLAVAATRHWARLGRSGEGLELLERSLALDDDAPPGLTIRAIEAAAWLRLRIGDTGRAIAYAAEAVRLAGETCDRTAMAGSLDALGRIEIAVSRYGDAHRSLTRALAIRRELGDEPGLVPTLVNLGHVAKWLGTFDEGIAHYDEARRLADRAGDRERVAVILNNLGDLLGVAGRPREAIPYLEAAVAIVRELNLPDVLPTRLANLAECLVMLGEAPRAIRLGEEAVAGLRNLDDREDTADTLYVLASAYHLARDDAAALRRYREALAIYDRIGAAAALAMTVEAMAATVVRMGAVETACRWLGFGEAERGRLGVAAYPVPPLAPALATCRRRLSPETFARRWEAGAGSTAARIAAEALTDATSPTVSARRRAGGLPGLTRRQLEVLRLVADGRTNGDIASALGISDRTVERHLAMIFAATGTDRRAAAVAQAMTRGWLHADG